MVPDCDCESVIEGVLIMEDVLLEVDVSDEVTEGVNVCVWLPVGKEEEEPVSLRVIDND